MLLLLFAFAAALLWLFIAVVSLTHLALAMDATLLLRLLTAKVAWSNTGERRFRFSSSASENRKATRLELDVLIAGTLLFPCLEKSGETNVKTRVLMEFFY